MTVLLDANVLRALVVADHVHHEAAETWLAESREPFATCPITEESLVRPLIREGQSSSIARAVIAKLVEHPRHKFWSDTASYREVPRHNVVGRRQVTDAYLVHLARIHQGKLAPFDRGLAALHGAEIDLLPARSDWQEA